MVEKAKVAETTPPLQRGESPQKLVQTEESEAARLPPTPISSASSILQKDGESAENGRPLVESSINSVTQALRNFVLPKSSSSIKARRHQSLPVSSITKSSVSAAHISNPTSSAHTPPAQSPSASARSPHQPPTSKSFKELSKLTSNAAAESRDKATPPMTPRTLSHEGRHTEKRSPLSSTSTSATARGAPTDIGREVQHPYKRDTVLPTHGPRGKLAVRIAEGRNLKPSFDPYVVCQFEWNEFVSAGARQDAMEGDDDHKKITSERLSSVPIRRTDSDMGRPMAIPMKSRQSSTNGVNEADIRHLTKVTDPQWNHEAIL